MQDFIAIAVAIVAALWLAWSLTKRFFAPPCQPQAGDSGDGFVTLDSLAKTAKTSRCDQESRHSQDL